MYDERLEGLRLALRFADRLIDAQVEEAKESVRLGETLLRVAVVMLTAQTALVGLLVTAIDAPRALVGSTALGAAFMIVATLRLVAAPGKEGAHSIVVGPDGRALAAVALEPDFNEFDLLRSRLRSLPLDYGRNAARLERLVGWRMAGSLWMTASISISAVGFVYIGGVSILG